MSEQHFSGMFYTLNQKLQIIKLNEGVTKAKVNWKNNCFLCQFAKLWMHRKHPCEKCSSGENTHDKKVTYYSMLTTNTEKISVLTEKIKAVTTLL